VSRAFSRSKLSGLMRLRVVALEPIRTSLMPQT
jgi:hypothetical protein